MKSPFHLGLLRFKETICPYLLMSLNMTVQQLLTQEYVSIIDRKNKKYQHPITHVSGLFWDSQLNWAALTKEASSI